MLTSVVGTSKPMLEVSFNARADILIMSDVDSKGGELKPNRYHPTEEQGLQYNLIGE